MVIEGISSTSRERKRSSNKAVSPDSRVARYALTATGYDPTL
jgi:hypothetical protein